MNPPRAPSPGRLRAATWVVAVLLLSGPAVPVTHAGVDMFMRVSGIAGESTDSVHAGDIDILSFQWGANSNAAVNGTVPIPTGSFSDITVTKRVDKSSPKLTLQTLLGTPVASVILYVRSKGTNPLEYLRITLSNVWISGITQGAFYSDSTTETVTLRYYQIRIDVVTLLANGNVGPTDTRTWNIQTQSGL
jgi:type VI secretion system secreted protein Hcp